MFDTHCHLQDLKIKGDLIIDRSRQHGVSRMLCCGTKPGDWNAVELLAASHDEIVPAYGVHPWFVENVATKDWKNELTHKLIENPKAVVGEIGLDSTAKPRSDELQLKVFVEQLALAAKYKRPVSVHCVRAWILLLNALENVGDLDQVVVLHSFSGSREIIHQLLSYNVYFSFSGAITNPSYKRASELVRAVPQNRLLIETDAPDMIPYDLKFNDLPNEPANLRYVAEKIAEFRAQTLAEVDEITTKNALRVFG